MTLSHEEMIWLIILPVLWPFVALRLCILLSFVLLTLIHLLFQNFNYCRTRLLQLRWTLGSTVVANFTQILYCVLWMVLWSCLTPFYPVVLMCHTPWLTIAKGV